MPNVVRITLTPPTIVAEVGQALFGHLWKRKLSRALGISEMTLRRWTRGETSVPVTSVDAMHHLMRERKQQLAQTGERLQQVVSDAA